MSRRYVFSSESVGEGHPDKVCDTISDAVLDACITQDRHSRVACETYAKSNIIVVGGEITIPNLAADKPLSTVLPINKIVRETVREIGYVNDDDVFHADKIDIQNIITKQSPDIAQGVDARAADGKDTSEQGAGDQGLMFGYACDETPELMPAPIMFAHRLGRELTRIRKSGKVGWLRPDAKSQVSVIYENGRPIGISCVVVSTQHSRDVKHSEIRSFIVEEGIKKVLRKKRLTAETKLLVTPTCNCVVGGPQGDTGLTGRKIIVDSYGGIGRHGGGAFSGKDPSKVDRSAAYAARHVAKNLVAAGLADRCEVQVSYAIGRAHPTSIAVETFGTGALPEEELLKLVRRHFDLRPGAIIANMDLLRPIYKQTAAYGHFGRDDLGVPWERTDKVEALRADASVLSRAVD